MKRAPPPLGDTATWAAAAAGAGYLGIFLKVSQELLVTKAGSTRVLFFDGVATRWVAELRRPWLTRLAVEVTSLGSPIVIGAIVIATAAYLWMTRDRLGAVLLAAAVAGAVGWTALLKDLIERERPPLAARLVVTSGYSFPSGHSLGSASVLGAITLIACRHLPSRAAQVLALVAAGLVIVAVAASRVYLGVHYLSDVAAGTSFGLAWALSWAAAQSRLENRRARRLADEPERRRQ